MTSCQLLSTIALQADTAVWSRAEVSAAIARPLMAIAMAYVVHRLVRRVPWSRPFRARVLAVHLLAAPLLAAVWGAVVAGVVALIAGGSFPALFAKHLGESLVFGMVLYVIVAGISYAMEGTARAARAESVAARTQLAALRAQLHPHFLFNALHTVVQLIPVEPARAAEAAELVAELLRTTLEEQRDEVRLGDEWRFVSRYLTLERIRFGDRLVVREEIAPRLLDASVPAFALQTLVENAVRHGAAPRVAATELVVSASERAGRVTIAVRNSGDAGAVPAGAGPGGMGTGLLRLRERLAVLHGSAARLEAGPLVGGGFEAVLTLPLRREGDA